MRTDRLAFSPTYMKYVLTVLYGQHFSDIRKTQVVLFLASLLLCFFWTIVPSKKFLSLLYPHHPEVLSLISATPLPSPCRADVIQYFTVQVDVNEKSSFEDKIQKNILLKIYKVKSKSLIFIVYTIHSLHIKIVTVSCLVRRYQDVICLD